MKQLAQSSVMSKNEGSFLSKIFNKIYQHHTQMIKHTDAATHLVLSSISQSM